MKGRHLVFAVPALALAIACENPQQPDGLRSPDDPSKIISDGAHGGNKDFFFLPPMVPLPLNNPDFELGKFNNALRPSLRIEICRLESTVGLPIGTTPCAATVKTFDPGTVKLVNLPLVENGWWNFFKLPPDGFYYVLWDTRQSNLDITKYYRIKVFVDGYPDPLGVADVDPMSNLREWKYSLTGEVIQLVDDVLLPIAFRVEKGALCEVGVACNSATITNSSPTGSQSLLVDQGGGSIAGARFPNGWLPSGTQCPQTGPCPQSVVVTIAEVNISATGPDQTVCHPALDPKLQQFRGCFNFTTTPRLQPFNEAGDQFAQPVTVAVCFELAGTGDPREKFVELYASGPNEPPHALPEVADGGLLGVLAKDCTPPVLTQRSSNPLTQFATTGWRKVKGGLGRLFGVKTAYAVDLGLGGIVKGFSNISPVLTAEIHTYTNATLTLGPGSTTTSTARIVGNSDHSTIPLTTGIGGLPVTFTPSNGSMVRALGADAPPASTAPITVITNINPIDGSPVSGGGFAPVNWTMPTPTAPGTYTYTLQADGPALGSPVTFTATVTVQLPDLVVSSGTPTVSPATITTGGGVVTLSPITVNNLGGNFVLAGGVRFGVYLSSDATITGADQLLGSANITPGALESGGSVTLPLPVGSVPAGTAAGNYYIGFLIDDNNAVAESNEGNNFVSAPFTVVAPPPPAAPTINGFMNAGEWDGSATFNFTANLPGGGTTPATLFVKNDAQNLYLAVRFAQNTVLSGDNRLGFEFDTNNDGLGPAVGDDYFVFQHTPISVFSDAFRSAGGGVTTDTQADGAGAFGNNETYSVYEISHPLNSGQTGQDFALTAGSTIGLFFQLIIGGVTTTFPGPFIQYTPITITGG